MMWLKMKIRPVNGYYGIIRRTDESGNTIVFLRTPVARILFGFICNFSNLLFAVFLLCEYIRSN